MNKKIAKEFRNFAINGNVVDLTVGVVVGGGLGNVINAFLNDLILPPLGLLIDDKAFKELAITLKPATKQSAGIYINYGLFLQSVFDFVLIAFVIFLIIKILNAIKKKYDDEEIEINQTNQQQLLTEIRDLLKEQADRQR